jgi:methionyl-tRNA formyltransferase
MDPMKVIFAGTPDFARVALERCWLQVLKSRWC